MFGVGVPVVEIATSAIASRNGSRKEGGGTPRNERTGSGEGLLAMSHGRGGRDSSHDARKKGEGLLAMDSRKRGGRDSSQMTQRKGGGGGLEVGFVFYQGGRAEQKGEGGGGGL